MTDNEIIKALEWCTNVMDCGKCLYSPYSGSGCATRLKTEVLDLIKRQQAEIERLKKELYTPLKHYYIRGVKEFTKRLCADRVSNDPVVIAAKCLEKEMTEGV